VYYIDMAGAEVLRLLDGVVDDPFCRWPERWKRPCLGLERRKLRSHLLADVARRHLDSCKRVNDDLILGGKDAEQQMLGLDLRGVTPGCILGS
jgi:hypothetical protein